MPQGYVSLFLHAHLPFVRHPEHDPFLEEDWLFEAITECYLPLLDAFGRLHREGVPFRVAMSVTPPLAAMLNDDLLRERYVCYLDRLLDLCEREVSRTRFDERLSKLSLFYQERLLRCREQFSNEYDGDVLGEFRRLENDGCLELVGCAATHGFLPILNQEPAAVRAQVEIGCQSHEACFGRRPKGFWLPECAYFPGVDEVLRDAGVRWFILDAHGVLHARPQPRFGVYAPIYTPAGTAAFGRDLESSEQVWSARVGYPGDTVYRDFYRDVGFDLEYSYIRPFLQPDGARKFTGLKYHRITGPDKDKDLYDPEAARRRADIHAAHFLASRENQIRGLRQHLGIEPIVLSPYDAELFGHWWFEGPIFLEMLLRKIASDQETFAAVTPSEYLTRHPTAQVATPAASTWGNQGYAEVWLNESNNWIYPHLHPAGRRMAELAEKFRTVPPTPEQERALRQAGRELLLAQSSDWAFIMRTGTAVDYATRRTREHLLRFTRIYEQIRDGAIDEGFVSRCEWRHNLFPDLDWRSFLSRS